MPVDKVKSYLCHLASVIVPDWYALVRFETYADNGLAEILFQEAVDVLKEIIGGERIRSIDYAVKL